MGDSILSRRNYTLPTDDEWIAPHNQYISSSEKEVNANLIYQFFKERMEYEDVAIAGLLGNCDHESQMNPNLWQGREEPANWRTTPQGYGLTQWSPGRLYLNWAGGFDYSTSHFSKQLECWEYESHHPSYSQNPVNEWYAPSDHRHPGDMYYVTWQKWGAGWNEERQAYDLTPEEAALIFMEDYLRPLESAKYPETRKQKARYWYNWIQGGGPTPVPGHMPIWLLMVIKKTMEGRK